MDPQIPVQNTNFSTNEENKSVGPAIGIVIIILILILGGLYFWGQRMNDKKINDTQTTADQNTSIADEELNQMSTQSTSDDTASIEADLNATNLDSLGSEMDNINTEANTSSQTTTP